MIKSTMRAAARPVPSIGSGQALSEVEGSKTLVRSTEYADNPTQGSPHGNIAAEGSVLMVEKVCVDENLISPSWYIWDDTLYVAPEDEAKAKEFISAPTITLITDRQVSIDDFSESAN